MDVIVFEIITRLLLLPVAGTYSVSLLLRECY